MREQALQKPDRKGGCRLRQGQPQFEELIHPLTRMVLNTFSGMNKLKTYGL